MNWEHEELERNITTIQKHKSSQWNTNELAVSKRLEVLTVSCACDYVLVKWERAFYIDSKENLHAKFLNRDIFPHEIFLESLLSIDGSRKVQYIHSYIKMIHIFPFPMVIQTLLKHGTTNCLGESILFLFHQVHDHLTTSLFYIIWNYLGWEETMNRIQDEKIKADQDFYSARFSYYRNYPESLEVRLKSKNLIF